MSQFYPKQPQRRTLNHLLNHTKRKPNSVAHDCLNKINFKGCRQAGDDDGFLYIFNKSVYNHGQNKQWTVITWLIGIVFHIFYYLFWKNRLYMAYWNVYHHYLRPSAKPLVLCPLSSLWVTSTFCKSSLLLVGQSLRWM